MTELEALLTQAASTTPSPGTPRMVAIDGPSGAGKTTFAEQVADELASRTGTRPQVVHMDDIFPGWDGLADSVDLVVRQVIEPLSRGEGGRFRRWDWASDARAEWVEVPRAEWIVLEGVGCGSRRCRPNLAALAWVEADRAVRMARGIERDGEAFRPHWERWAVQEQELFAVEDTRSHADVILTT